MYFGWRRCCCWAKHSYATLIKSPSTHCSHTRKTYSTPVHGLNLVVVSPVVEACAGLQELVATEVVQNPGVAQTATAEEATSAQKTQATLGLAAQG